MYNFFMGLINNAPTLIDLGRRQDVAPEQSESPAIEPVFSKETSIANSDEHDPELSILEKEFGQFYEGMKIEIDLHSLLDLIPRARKKSDSFKGLRSRLRKQGVELIITSTRLHNKQKGDE